MPVFRCYTIRFIRIPAGMPNRSSLDYNKNKVLYDLDQHIIQQEGPNKQRIATEKIYVLVIAISCTKTKDYNEDVGTNPKLVMIS